MKKKLTIKLLSDCLPGSGAGDGAFIDTNSVYDELGFPIIPGKRLKGCLREAAMNLVAMGCTKDANEIDALFGTEREEGTLRIDNAQIEGIESIRRRIEACRPKQDEKDVDFLLMPNLIREYYSVLHTRTAIDDNGVAKDKSLRTVRAIRKGTIFVCSIEFPKEEVQFVTCCTKALRFIGTNRNRGFGHVELTLEADQQAAVQGDCPNKSNVLELWLRLKTPVLVDEPFIPAIMIRGALAAHWMKTHDAPESGDYADDEEFRKLFIEGLCYQPAYPTDAKRQRYFPVPASVVRYKVRQTSVCEFVDLAVDEPPQAQTKRISNGMVFAPHDEQNKVYKIEPTYTEHMHHSQAGELFSYRALAENGRYLARINGEPDTVRLMYEFIKENMITELHIGRSRTAQYGCVSIEKVTSRKEEQTMVSGKRFAMTLQTPTILLDEFGTASTDCKSLLSHLKMKLNAELKMEACFSVPDSVEGYNPQWRLSKQPVLTLGARTTVVFSSGKGLELPAYLWLGERNSEGYGLVQLREANPDVKRTPGFDAIEPDDEQLAEDTAKQMVKQPDEQAAEQHARQQEEKAWQHFLQPFMQQYFRHILQIRAMNNTLDIKAFNSRTLQQLYALAMGSSGTTWNGIDTEVSKIKDSKKNEKCVEVLASTKKDYKDFRNNVLIQFSNRKVKPAIDSALWKEDDEELLIHYLRERLRASIVAKRTARGNAK